MANDDGQIKLGVDIEALQRSASQAANILAKTFEQQNFGANVLGSGMPATQLPQAGGGGKDTLRGVIDALERIERTLTIGFTSMTGGVYTGGGGGGGAGTQPPPSQPGKQGGGNYGWGDALSRAGDLSSALMPSFNNMFQGGFYGTDVVGAANSFVSQIPGVGKLLSSMITPFHQELGANDDFRDRQYQTFRDSGPNAMAGLTDLWTPSNDEGESAPGLYEQFTNKYGMSRSETQSLVGSGYKNGLNFGNQGMEAVMNAQGVLGLGSEAAGTLGALNRGGLNKKDDTDALASAIGVAVSTNLERGRWSEMFTMWQRAAQSSIDVDVSMKDIIGKNLYVGSLGERYKGDSAANQAMQGSITAAASNTQSPLAFSAAMQLTGSYSKAMQRMAAEAQQPDVELEDAMMARVEGSGPVQDYLNSPPGDESMLADAAQHAFNLISDIPALRWKVILQNRKKTGRSINGVLPAGAVDQGRQIMTGNTALPDTAISHLRSETRKQRPSDISAIQEDASDKHYGQSVSQPGSGSGSPSSIPGMSQLTQTDIESAAQQAGIPVETMQSWFQMESGGDIQSRDTKQRGLEDFRGARGYGQVTLEEARSLGYGIEDWRKMSTDKKLSLEASAKLAAKYYAIAKQNAPAGWSEADKLHLMKYQHGGTGFAKAGISDYRGHHGGKDPSSWKEFYGAESGSKDVGYPSDPTQAHRALNNANNLTVTIKVDQQGKVIGHMIDFVNKMFGGPPGQMTANTRR